MTGNPDPVSGKRNSLPHPNDAIGMRHFDFSDFRCGRLSAAQAEK
jgi:hypothetical protein